MKAKCPRCNGTGEIQKPDPPRCPTVLTIGGELYQCTSPAHTTKYHQPSLFTVEQEEALRVTP